jgi:hypothetical protein
MTAHPKFERERYLVESLMRRLALTVEQYIDPNKETRDETGADVVIVVDGNRIGIQVTELDTGEIPGQLRSAEKASLHKAQNKGQCTYFAWAQNDLRMLLKTIARAVISKNQHIDACNEAWLLISSSVPELGSLGSTFVNPNWLKVNDLDAATIAHLGRSIYSRAFLHVIVSSEDALYCWTAAGGWQKAFS